MPSHQSSTDRAHDTVDRRRLSTETITLLTIGYTVSRGLAKSGSRDFYDADDRRRS